MLKNPNAIALQWNGFYEAARQQNRGLFRILGEVPDAAAYRRRKRSSLRPNDLLLAALKANFAAKNGAASTCSIS